MALPEFTMRQLLEAGVHFGHQTQTWLSLLEKPNKLGFGRALSGLRGALICGTNGGLHMLRTPVLDCGALRLRQCGKWFGKQTRHILHHFRLFGSVQTQGFLRHFEILA